MKLRVRDFGSRRDVGPSVRGAPIDRKRFYYVGFEAEVELLPGDGQVLIEVVSTRQDNPDPELLQQSVDAIRIGAERVLRPRGLQACLKLSGLGIEGVMCDPREFERATEEALTAALAPGARRLE